MLEIAKNIDQYLLERRTCSHFFVRFINLKGFMFHCNCGKSYLNLCGKVSHLIDKKMQVFKDDNHNLIAKIRHHKISNNHSNKFCIAD